MTSYRPRYRLAASTALYYHFVNVHSSGISREHYTIPRAEFWGPAHRFPTRADALEAER